MVENNCVYVGFLFFFLALFFSSLVEKVLRIKPLAQLCLSFLMHNRGIQVHLAYSFSKNVNCPTLTFCCLFSVVPYLRFQWEVRKISSGIG